MTKVFPPFFEQKKFFFGKKFDICLFGYIFLLNNKLNKENRYAFVE